MYAGAAVQAERLAAGEVSARELVECALTRIDAKQGGDGDGESHGIGAFRVVRHEAARAAAAEADRRTGIEAWLGRLIGRPQLPVAPARPARRWPPSSK